MTSISLDEVYDGTREPKRCLLLALKTDGSYVVGNTDKRQAQAKNSTINFEERLVRKDEIASKCGSCSTSGKPVVKGPVLYTDLEAVQVRSIAFP